MIKLILKTEQVKYIAYNCTYTDWDAQAFFPEYCFNYIASVLNR